MPNTALAYPRAHGGWINEQAATGMWLGLAILTAFANCSVNGTGAEPSFSHRNQGNSLKSYVADSSAHAAVHRSASDNLRIIKNVLKPAVSDLATSLGVSRQTVYNWLNGEAITQDGAIHKLQDLAKAAEILEQAGVAINATLHKRKFAQGKTLMQVVESNGSAYDAALLLVDIHKQEVVQRERMTTRLQRERKRQQLQILIFLLPANNLRAVHDTMETKCKPMAARISVGS
ncbi:hypothetical protein ACSZMR_12910 [Aeromonas veronii]